MASKDDYIANPLKSDRDFLKLSEVAEWLGVNQSLIYDWVQKERLPVVRLGKGVNSVIRFQRGQVIDWARQRVKVSDEVASTLEKSGFSETPGV